MRTMPSSELFRWKGAAFALLVALGSTSVPGCGDDEQPAEDKPEAKVLGLTAEQASQPLVEIGDKTITVGEFAERLAQQSTYHQARLKTPEGRREFLDNIVRFELMAREANRLGYHQLPQVERAREQVMVQLLLKELVQDQVKLADISDEEVEAYYEAHQQEFHKPAQVRASHILYKTQRQAERALSKVKERMQQDAAEGVALFRELAHARPGPRELESGDLGFFATDGVRAEGAEVPAELVQAAFSVDSVEEQGGLYPEVVKTPRGYHLVRLTARREALERSLQDVRQVVRNMLWEERREARVEQLVEKLRSEMEIEENYELLDQVQVRAGEQGSAGAPPKGQ